MMRIDHSNQRVNWGTNIPVSATAKTGKTEGPGEGVSLTVTDGSVLDGGKVHGHHQRVTIAPPAGNTSELDRWAAMDAIQGVLDASGIDNLSDDELGAVLDFVSYEMASMSKKDPLFGILELMQLLIEINQKQRENVSLMRQSEAIKMQADNQARADLLRSGAVQNFIQGVIGAAVSIASSLVSIGVSVKALRGMNRQMSNEIGLERQELYNAGKLTDTNKAATMAKNAEQTLGRKAGDPSYTVEDTFTPKDNTASKTTLRDGESVKGELPEREDVETRSQGSDVENKPAGVENKSVDVKSDSSSETFHLLDENKAKNNVTPKGGETQNAAESPQVPETPKELETPQGETPNVEETPQGETPQGTEKTSGEFEHEFGENENVEGKIPDPEDMTTPGGDTPTPDVETPETPEGVGNGNGADKVAYVDREVFGETRGLLFDENGNFQLTGEDGKPIPFKDLPLKEGVTEADLKNVKNVRQALDVLNLEDPPKGSPQAKFIKEFKAKLGDALSSDYETQRANYTSLKDNIDTLEGQIEAGTWKDSGEFATKKEAQLKLANMKQEAEALKADLNYANAVQTYGESMCRDNKAISDKLSMLQGRLETAKLKLANSSQYKVLENRLQMAGTWSQLGNSIKEMFSGIGNYLQSMKQAESVEAEGQQQEAQAEMDSLKEMVQKFDESLRAMIELMKEALDSGVNTRMTMA